MTQQTIIKGYGWIIRKNIRNISKFLDSLICIRDSDTYFIDTISNKFIVIFDGEKEIFYEGKCKLNNTEFINQIITITQLTKPNSYDFVYNFITEYECSKEESISNDDLKYLSEILDDETTEYYHMIVKICEH